LPNEENIMKKLDSIKMIVQVSHDAFAHRIFQ